MAYFYQYCVRKARNASALLLFSSLSQQKSALSKLQCTENVAVLNHRSVSFLKAYSLYGKEKNVSKGRKSDFFGVLVQAFLPPGAARQQKGAKKLKKQTNKAIYLAQGAMIAAAYAAATYLSSVFGLAYGNLQFRFSEALTILSVFTPAAIPGLTVGCILGNISSPMGIWDIAFGSAATLLAAISARKLRKITLKGLPFISLIMPVIFNAIIVGAEITFLLIESEATFSVFLISALEVGAGELAVCIAGGIPLFYAIKKSGLFKKTYF